jgi:hypothetical protein
MFFAVNLLPFCNHVFTTKSPQITIKKPHSAHQKTQKPPAKDPFGSQKNKSKKKETPKPFCGSGVVGLQTARKPNSVLDDHSSTRPITEPL